MNRSVLIALVWLLLLVAAGCQQQKAATIAAATEPAKDSDVTGKTVATANAFLNSLDAVRLY